MSSNENQVMTVLFNSLKGGNEQRIMEIVDGFDTQKRLYYKSILEVIRPNYQQFGRDVADRVDRTIELLS